MFREFDDVQSTLVVMPTGTGKTRVASQVAETGKKRGWRTLFLAHREVLVRQAAETLLASGLDVSVEMGSEYARENAALLGDSSVVVGTVQSLQGARLDSFDPDYFQLIVTDECHRAADSSHRNVYAHFPRACHLGITATPDGSSCNIGNIYKTCAYQLTIGDAIREGYLVKVHGERCKTKVDLRNIRTTGGDYNAGDISERISGQLEQLADGTKQRIGDRPCVVFTPCVGSAKGLAAAMSGRTASGPGLDARYVAGGGGTFGMGERDRRELLAQFRAGSFQVVCCCELLIEGWDAPHVSAVVIARPTRLRYRYCQMVGRGTRLFPGKDDCIVVDFDWHTDQSTRELMTPVDLFAAEDPDLALLDAMQRESIINDAGRAMKMGERDPSKALEKAKEAARRVRDLPVFLSGMAAEFEVEHYDPAGVAKLLGVKLKKRYDYARPGYESAKDWQRRELASYGVESPEKLSFFGAHKMLRTIKQRAEKGLATQKQINRLLRIGIGEIQARAMTASQAHRVLSEYGHDASTTAIRDLDHNFGGRNYPDYV